MSGIFAREDSKYIQELQLQNRSMSTKSLKLFDLLMLDTRYEKYERKRLNLLKIKKSYCSDCKL
jgi:hypothetical protein